MARNKKNNKKKQNQEYDTCLKELIEQQPFEVLALLVPGAIYQETLNVETVRPTMRADKVYRVDYNGTSHIVHIEFQVSPEPDLLSRLLVYNSVFYQEHQLPVLTIVVYPFRTTVPKPPLYIMSGEQEIIRFNYTVLPLWERDATKYVGTQALCMYSLLPTMSDVDHAIMQQAIEELIVFYQNDKITLAQRFTWMVIFLERTDTIIASEKQKIWEILHMYDQLWEESPRVQLTRAQSKSEGELLASRKMVLTVVKTRFPALCELAEQQVSRMTDTEALLTLTAQIVSAADEEAVCWLLEQAI